MFRLKRNLFIVLVAALLLNLACQEEAPTSVSVDGAIIETGIELDEQLRVITPQTAFRVNEEFYFYFYNNSPFGVDRLTVQLVDGRNDRVLAEHTYEVEPDGTDLADGIFFGNAGRFVITVRINGIIRASRMVEIE